MSLVNRPNRKASDADIIRLNSLGLSLSTIAEQLGCHPTTITLRLTSLGIKPADTRRTFMEDIYKAMPAAQQEWLAAQLGPHMSIKDYLKNLLVTEFVAQAAQDHMDHQTDKEREAFQEEASRKRAAYEQHREEYRVKVDVFLKETIALNRK